jgi:hypothetical protein
MTESRAFPAKNLDVQELVQTLGSWLDTENFEKQSINTADGAVLIQIAKRGGWRKALGMSTALNVVLRQSDPHLNVEIGAGRWADKAVAGAVSMVILWPLMFTSAYGAWEQVKMPTRIFEQIGLYLSRPHSLVVNLDPEKRFVTAAMEKVQVPAGVKIKVRRSRVVEHSVSLRQTTTSESTITIADVEIFSNSVRKAFEETTGTTSKESETIEHEVELDGTNRHEYTLMWVDIIRHGTIEYVQGTLVASVPFEFREQTELRVT